MMKVYLITCGHDQYKIGVTRRDVNKRVKELKTGNSNPLEVLSVFESKWARKIETYMHKKFKHNLIDGEWFYLSDEDITNFTKNCKKVHDGLELMVANNTWIEEIGGYK